MPAFSNLFHLLRRRHLAFSVGFLDRHTHAQIDHVAHSLQPLLDAYERDESVGEGDMPYPPDYPKMPGEPKRVQPSRDRDRKSDDDRKSKSDRKR